MKQHFPKRPPRIRLVFDRFDPPLYFITLCTYDRRPVLANDAFHDHIFKLMKRKSTQGIVCGEYVIMPDHVHLFIRIDLHRYQLGKTIGFLKQSLSKPLRDSGVEQPHWQPGFFDHILRSADSYSEKWAYVRDNPVEAGYVDAWDKWKYQGVIAPIRY